MLLNIIITVIVIIVTSMLLLGLLSGYIVNDRSRTLTEEADRVNQMTVFYINNRNDAVEDFYKMSLRNVSNRIRGIIYIVDRRGNVISSDNASETVNMSKIDADFAQKVLSGKKTVEVGNLDGLYNHTFLTVGVPLAFGDEIVGATYLAMPMPEINRYKYHIFRITISAITTAIIVAMVISYIYSRKASKPIMDLNNAAKAVANGNFDVKVSTDGDSEMAELSSNFNAMVESLKSLEDMRSSFIANVSHELRTPMTTISGFVVGTYWFLMLIGRLAGASLGAKISSKAMLTFTSALGLLLVFLAIFSSTGSLVNLPVLQQSATGGLSFGFAEVPINAMYLVLVGLCTSIMWGGIFNLAVEGLGKYLAAASGLFMVLVCGGGILPVIQGLVADIAGFMPSYWVIIAALGYLLFYGLVGCKNVNKDIKVD